MRWYDWHCLTQYYAFEYIQHQLTVLTSQQIKEWHDAWDEGDKREVEIQGNSKDGIHQITFSFYYFLCQLWCISFVYSGFGRVETNGREWCVHLGADSNRQQIPFHSLLSVPPSSGRNISFTSINDMKFHFSFLKDTSKRKGCNCHVNMSFLFIPSLMDSHCEDLGV